MSREVDAALLELVRRLDGLGVVTSVWVGGSLAAGDHVSGVSDLDLVAVTSGALDAAALEQVVRIHRSLDGGIASAKDLGCQYVDADRLADVGRQHPTWTHGHIVNRSLSLVTRAELFLQGFPVLGRSPQDVLRPVGPDEVRAAARAELAGYWSDAARRPWMFIRMPVMVDLGLTAMARGRHAIATGGLLTKTGTIEEVRAPAWLMDQMRARRRGETVASPRWRGGLTAWRDVVRTTSSMR